MITNNTLLPNPLLAALQRIADAPANGNSNPDRMAAALDAAIMLAHDTASAYENGPIAPFTVFVPGQLPITLEQGDDGQFSVTYGAELRVEMSYDQAGDHLGHAIMYALQQAGVIHDLD